MFKKVLFVAAVMMMMIVGCAGDIAGEINHEFDGEFETEMMEALNLPDELTVTKRINGDTVYSERINTDDDHKSRFDHDESFEIDKIKSFDFSFEDGIQFEMSGVAENGDDVTVSADLTKDNDSTVTIDVTD